MSDPRTLDYHRLLEVLVIQGRREEGEEIDQYARRLWHHYVYDDAYSDVAPLNPDPTHGPAAKPYSERR